MSRLDKIFANRITKWSIVFVGLAVFAIGNWFFRTFMTNFDERDHIAAGYLMSKGWVLYKDIFSHHFPLPYYWVKFWDFLWVNQLPFRGIAMFRSTLTIFYLFCSLLVIINLKKFSNILVFLVFLISLIPLLPLFHGNILLSESFAFFPLLMIIWIAFSGLNNDIKISPWPAISSAILCSFSFWSQPLLIPVFLLPVFYLNNYRKLFIQLSALTIITPLLIFFLNGSLNNFISMGVIFNLKIYPRYYTDIEGIKPGLSNIIQKIIENQTLLTLKINIQNIVLNSQQIGSWVLVITALLLLIKKNLKYLILLLISIALVRIREVKINPGELFNFGILPYMMLINLVFMALIYRIKKNLKLLVILPFMLYLFFLLKAAEPIIRQSSIPGYNYHVFWSDRQAIGQEINSLIKNNDKILIYPHDVDLYYFAKRTPPDKFLYWFPWINEVAAYRQEREQSISNKVPKVIYLGDMKFKNNPNFYQDMWPNITSGYSQATTEGKYSGIWSKI